MRYKEIPVLSRCTIEEDLANGDTHRKTIAIISSALYDDDNLWTEKHCVELLRCGDWEMKYAAIVSLGHLLRRFGGIRNDIVLPLLDKIDDARLEFDVEMLRHEINVYSE